MSKKIGILFGFLPQEDLRASPEGNCTTIIAVETSNVNMAVGDDKKESGGGWG
jgi:hypothetical protein